MSFFGKLIALPGMDAGRRMLFSATLFLGGYALILTLSPAGRERSWDVAFLWQHWLGFVVWAAGFFLAHRAIQKYLPDRDTFLLPLAALLSGWGLLSIWRLTTEFGLRQTLWLAIALTLFIVGLRLSSDLQWLRRYKYLWLTGGFILTALTLFFGTNPLGFGPQLWLGCCGVYLQPSEPLKLLLIIFLAAYLADRKALVTKIAPLLAPTLVMAGLALALLLVQRDLGTAFILVFIYTALVYVSTGSWRLVLFSLATAALAGLAAYFLFDVVALRIEAWLNPWADPSDRSYQIVQSLLAIANGGMLGRGPGLGNPGLVPIALSDFIYASIAEETGLMGTIALLVTLALFSMRALQISLHAENSFHRYLSVGIAAFLGGQSILIIGGTTRLLPLTGVTLPFISYGGSSLVTTFLALLILIHISQKSNQRSQPQNSKAILHIGSLLLLGFAAASLTTGWWAFYRGPELLLRTDNPRRTIADRFVLRGRLLDQNVQILSESIGESGDYQRVYLSNLGPSIGYTHPVYGQAGLEADLDLILRGEEFQPAFDLWINHLLYGQPPPGNDVQLTVEAELQTLAQQLLGDMRGAAVVLNANSGEILVLASSPTFDANQLDENWGNLLGDPDAPLLNRATQGSYTPGTSFGPFLLTQALASEVLPPIPQELDYSLGEQSLSCVSRPDDPTTWANLISVGCAAPLAALGIALDAEELQSLFQNLGFYNAPQLRLTTRDAVDNTIIAVPEAEALGQGELRISPLQLARAYASLSNEGMLPALRIVSTVNTQNGESITLPTLDEPQSALNELEAVQVLGSLSNGQSWEVQANAQVGEESSLNWYITGNSPSAGSDNYVVVVLLEEGTASDTQDIGLELLAWLIAN